MSVRIASPRRYWGSVGEVRDQLGQQFEESAVELPIGWQPDHSRAYAGCLRGGYGCQRQALPNCCERFGWFTGKLRSGERARAAQRRRRWNEPGSGGETSHRTGGIYDGHELPKGINKMTWLRRRHWLARGCWRWRATTSTRRCNPFVHCGFAEVEVDLETGHYHIVDYLGVADVGTVIHQERSEVRS